MVTAKMKKVEAIVRTDCVPGLIQALKGADVSRFYLTRTHAVGAGIDPKDFRASLDQGGVYTEKTKVEFLCRGARSDELVELVREWTATGHRGDGVVIVSEVTDVVNVRTGDHDRVALL
jgi:nitrogen regulatory protein PII